jgi:hypothetical protein
MYYSHRAISQRDRQHADGDGRRRDRTGRRTRNEPREYIHFLIRQADDSLFAVAEQSLTTAGVESKKDCVMILINETPQRPPAETT